MILAAGLGTRLRPLTALRPKVAVPVRGLPLIAYPLHWLAHHGVDEVVVNTHHHPAQVRDAALAHAPPGMRVQFSHEAELLDTGGGLRRVADFLGESDPFFLVAGDMVLDADLTALAARHASRGDSVTLLLSSEAPQDTFGTIGVDGEGRVRRIASRFDLGGEARRGVYVSVNVVSARALETLPERERFGHLDHWLAPLLAAGADDIRGELDLPGGVTWQPVGTPQEYLAANLEPATLTYLPLDAPGRLQESPIGTDVLIGAHARLGEGCRLERAVVWDGETVPAGFRGSDGVFAGGRFHACGDQRRVG